MNDVFAASVALLMLTAMGSLGVMLLRFVPAALTASERIVYGVPLGVVAVSLALVPVAGLVGLSAPLVVIAALVCAALSLMVARWSRRSPDAEHSIHDERRTTNDDQARTVKHGGARKNQRSVSGSDGEGADPTGVRGRMLQLRPQHDRPSLHPPFLPSIKRWSWGGGAVFPAIVLGLLLLRLAVFWSTALQYEPDGLWANHVNIWGDWTQHIGDVYSFVYGGNIPPDHPRFANHSYPYHYLASFTAALMVEAGMQPTTALLLHSFIFSALIAFGIYAFAVRLTAHRGAATLAVMLFFLGGGLGWTLVLGQGDQPGGILAVLWQHPWDQAAQEAANYRWHNLFFSFIAPQRGYLYGLPLGLLVLTLLLDAARTHERRVFVVAGAVAALLPLAHLSTMLALALIAPFLLLAFPSRRWAAFFAVWIALALPQLYFQQGGGSGALAALRVQLGWVAAPDPWLWFWLKNLGGFVPLLALALWWRDMLPPVSRRFLLAFMPVFAIANVAVFQPWDWDNAKVLLYWFLAVCVLVAAVVVRVWQRHSNPLLRGLLVLLVATMLASGVLHHLNQLLGRDRNLMLTAEELELGAAVRAQTPPDAIFAAGLQHNHPISVVSGRRVVLGYPGPLWATGLDYQPRERDIRALYTLPPDTADLIARYHIRYIVVGPWERDHLGANVAAFRARFPVVISTAHYEVFSTR